jgi:hypothetical protein
MARYQDLVPFGTAGKCAAWFFTFLFWIANEICFDVYWHAKFRLLVPPRNRMHVDITFACLYIARMLSFTWVTGFCPGGDSIKALGQYSYFFDVAPLVMWILIELVMFIILRKLIFSASVVNVNSFLAMLKSSNDKRLLVMLASHTVVGLLLFIYGATGTGQMVTALKGFSNGMEQAMAFVDLAYYHIMITK